MNDEEHAALTELGKAAGGISAMIREHVLDKRGADDSWKAVREVLQLARDLSFFARELKHFPPERAVEILIWLRAVNRQLNETLNRL